MKFIYFSNGLADGNAELKRLDGRECRQYKDRRVGCKLCRECRYNKADTECTAPKNKGN